MKTNRYLSIGKTVDCYPMLTPIERQKLYWFERQDYFSSPSYLGSIDYSGRKILPEDKNV